MTKRLSDCVRGESAIVKGFEGDEILAQRLMAMGMHPGQRVTRAQRAPFAGPVKIDGSNTVIALRTEDAAGIQVEGNES